MKELSALIARCIKGATKVELLDENGDVLVDPRVVVDTAVFFTLLDDLDLMVRHK